MANLCCDSARQCKPALAKPVLLSMGASESSGVVADSRTVTSHPDALAPECRRVTWAYKLSDPHGGPALLKVSLQFN